MGENVGYAFRLAVGRFFGACDAPRFERFGEVRPSPEDAVFARGLRVEERGKLLNGQRFAVAAVGFERGVCAVEADVQLPAVEVVLLDDVACGGRCGVGAFEEKEVLRVFWHEQKDVLVRKFERLAQAFLLRRVRIRAARFCEHAALHVVFCLAYAGKKRGGGKGGGKQ